ncbi:Der GTPase-activating protein YihI [Vibrio sp. SCSIO 43136]|uniref:Der GTPase-activating protein YihI n=1 Tax=Vibrio sp. SCSIO 43136 TaxID=2819101 RepID=UPI002074B04C|nr:Der GTPase-activating protein YihI [Vibrio sp. SCSIO 43136]USD65208.1 Der GTPase-activating protein YihI [Vibrio sp. SCSIO 43136]
MSRSKKSRKPGAAGAPEFVVTRNRTQSDVDGRLRKRAKKRKGLKSGSRHSEGESTNQTHGGKAKDPRLGSKKKIPLIIEPVKKQTKAERRLSAEQELAMLENDTQLNVLLDRLESGENLGAGLQKYVDEKLDRIEVLMKQLGIYEDESSQDSEPAISSISDEDLLGEFDDFDMDEFKD